MHTQAMQRAKVPTFRPTVWPAEPPDLPPVTRYVLEDGPGTGELQVRDVDREREQAELPPDFVLRELLEVPEDDASLGAFMREWGLLVDLPSKGLVISLEGARRHLLELQAVARHLIAFRDGNEAAEIEAWDRVVELTQWEPLNIRQARLWFQMALNRSLRPFGVHVRLSPDDNAALTRPVPNLHNVAALQLARYLNSDRPITRCGNERCGRPFTVQRSPRRLFENSHHAAGVRYCSHLCAKAQSERDRRARRRAEGGQR